MKKLTRSRPGHQHARQADRDVEVAGELENRPVLLGGVERNELGAHRPFVVLQTAEDAVELAQLGVENLDCLSVRITDCLLVRRCSQDCRHVFPSSNSTRRVVTRS